MKSSLSGQLDTFFPSVWLWLVLFVWGVFFSRAWFGQVYAKWREVRAFSRLPYEQQIGAIYGHEMPLLQTKVRNLPRVNSELLLVVPEKPYLYPIANNPPLLRALTQGKYDIVALDQVKIDEAGVVFWHPEQFVTGSIFPPRVERISLESSKGQR